MSHNKKSNKEKKSLSDYKFDITSISNNAEFTKILKYLIKVIKKNSHMETISQQHWKTRYHLI